ncbi:MAG: tetratricopeptide repeat protein [Flavobacteriales bacterium]
MKKIILAALVFSSTTIALAQGSKDRTTAIMSYNKVMPAMQTKDMGKAKKDILKAKEYIDKALEDEKMKSDPKTYFYKGEIYFTLLSFAMDIDVKPIVEQESFGGEVKGAYAKAIELDSKNEYKPQIEQKMNMYRALSMNAGSDFFQKKEYEMAQASFEAAVAMWDIIGMQDTLAYFYAGMAAEYQNRTDKAIEYYSKAVDLQFNDVVLYQLLVIQYKNDVFKDSPKRLEVLEKGRSLYPSDQTLIIEEFNYHIEKGNNDKAQAALAKAIELDPRNPILYYNIGVVYDGLQDYAKAEDAYKKAIEFNKDYFEANYNLAAMYVNQGVEMSSKASDIKDFKLYEKELQKAMDQYRKAIPYFERALEIIPDELDTWKSIASLYYKLDMTEKYEAAEKKVEELSKK